MGLAVADDLVGQAVAGWKAGRDAVDGRDQVAVAEGGGRVRLQHDAGTVTGQGPYGTIWARCIDLGGDRREMELAVCAEMVFLELPVVERVRRIADLGFLVEIWDWTRKDIDALVAYLGSLK